jgi:hypothetical protein
MESALPKRNAGMTIVAVLALVQSVLGVLRTLHWFDAGSDLMGQGLLLFPLMGCRRVFPRRLRGCHRDTVRCVRLRSICGPELGKVARHGGG